MLDLGVDLDVWPWIWLFIAVAFTLIELTVLGGSFVLLPFAASAFVAAILGFYDVAIEVQWIVFVAGGAALFLVFLKWARRFTTENPLQPGVGADRLVGLVGTVTADVSSDDVERKGRVAIAGEVWGVVPCDAPLLQGTKVRVVAVQGTRVRVEPVVIPAAGLPEQPSEGDHP